MVPLKTRLADWIPPLALWSILAVACGLPLAWLAVQLVARPGLWGDAIPDSFRAWLIVRTFAFNALAATLAMAFALPIALTLAFGGRCTRWLWWLLPVPLLVPSLVITYGWKQAVGLAGIDPLPQSFADVARCIVALASWLWPVPAMAVAFALARLDGNLLMQATLDGAVGRTVARVLAAPVMLGWSAAMLLALQEFAVFEPTGISVIATEVRFVFETGASLDQSWSMLPDGTDGAGPTQDARMGAALAVMLPAIGLMLLLAGVAWRTIRSLDGSAGEWGERAGRIVRLPRWVSLLASIEALVLIGLPIAAMALTRQGAFRPWKVLDEYRPQLLGSIGLGALAGACGVACVVLASVGRPSRKMIGVALASFLIGGQWAAIALIVLFNRPWLLALYDSYLMPTIAYVGRFVWIALIAAAATWSPGVRPLRELAATDGAGPWATWRSVILPIAWPLLAGACLLIFTLSMTEVPATTLLQPANTLVPMLMTWAHILNYDAMIDASLLLCLVVMTAGAAVVGLVRLSIRMTKSQ